MAIDALEQAVLSLYGPEGANQTSTFRMASYSMDHLKLLLEGNSPQFMEADLGRADWVVISLSDSGAGQVDQIKRFLSSRQDLLRNRRVILFSFGAPYYMDATDISKLTAYYALYSKQSPFVDVAARLLFEELSPTGYSPVSIPGVGYDLISAMMPDPDQIISLALDFSAQSSETGTPQPTPMPLFRIGDTIAVRTGVLRDHNGHAVPDGTVVRFSMLLTGEGGGILQQVDAVTQKGVAKASFGLDKPGLLEIKAASDPAVVSEALRMDVTLAGGAAVTVVVPVLTETIVTEPPPLPTEEPDPFVSKQGRPTFNAWLLNLLLLAGGAALAYWVASRIKGGREGVRWSLCVLLGGLVAYNYVALGMPGVTSWTISQGMFGILLFTMGGQVIGALAAAWWGRRSSASRSQSS
jgi:beta-N-acetylhexosaminidase